METKTNRAIKMHQDDTVATCLSDIKGKGEEVQIVNVDGTTSQQVWSKSAIPFGHKICLRGLKNGEPVYKYGTCIGRASRPIGSGEWVHIHNITSVRIPIPEERLKAMISMMDLPEICSEE